MLVLVGMPGSGKSTIGRYISRNFSLPFFDLDALIIDNKIHVSISDFFASEGEEKFREFESEVLEEIVSLANPAVVATGGGIVVNPKNCSLLKEAGTVIYLNSTPTLLYKRLRHDTSRPLLKVEDPLTALEEIYSLRHPLYMSVADLVVEVNDCPVPQIASEIMGFYNHVNP